MQLRKSRFSLFTRGSQLDNVVTSPCLHEGAMLQSELRHVLDVLIDEYKNVKMPSQSNVKFIVAYVEIRKSRIFKSTRVNQLIGNPTLSKD